MQTLIRKRWRELAFVAFLAVGLILATTVDVPTLDQLRRWNAALGPMSVVAFSMLYILVTQFPIPRTALTVSSGVLFGPVVGVMVALLSTTVAATVSITMLRALLGVDQDDPLAGDSLVKRWARSQGRHKSLAKITERLEHRGWLSVFCLRLIPGLPFSVLNYACVVTPVRRRDFVIATFFGSAPSTIIGVLLGDSLTSGNGQGALVLLGCLGVLGLIGIGVDLLLPVKAKA
ncbi:TVP38/TMEM64 family protein [Corynebacterium sp. H130]|uniref:TVP38/TMEM64 family protein n=1 Tax=Corynebacterium sp. H130 TaxID=3133444 RepID=UPI0030AFA541